MTLPPARGRGRRQGPVDRRPLRARRADAGGGRRAGLPGLRQPGRRLPVPGHGGHLAGRRRGAGHDAAARRAGALGPADLARHGPPLGAGARRAWPRRGSTSRDILTDAADPQRHGRPRGVRRLDQPAAAHPGHRLRRRPARGPTVEDWHAVNRKVPRLVSVLPNGPYDHPTVRVFLAGGVPEVMLHLRALGPARRLGADRDRRAAGANARLVGSQRAPEAAARAAVRGRRRRSRRRDHEPGARQGAGADQHRHLPARQPGAGGLGDQEHGDRPERGRRRRRLPQDRPGAGLHARERRDRRDQGAGRPTRSSPATCWC